MPVHPYTCPLCEASCGLHITTEGERVVGVVGDPDDHLSAGHICPKALALQDLHEDPDRLQAPVRRTDGGWEELSWDDALDLCAEGIRDLQRRHGRDSLAVYLGNPTVHNLPALLYGPDLQRTLRTRQRYSATSADQLPHMMVANHVFGHQLLMPVPDVDRTDWL